MPLIAELDGEIAAALDAAPELEGKQILFAFVDPTNLSEIGFYTSHDTRPGFLESLGLPAPAIVDEESAGTTDFYVQVSSEVADRFADVDLIVTYGETDGAIIDQVQADPAAVEDPGGRRRLDRDPRELDAARRVGEPVAAVDRLGHRRLLRTARRRAPAAG